MRLLLNTPIIHLTSCKIAWGISAEIYSVIWVHDIQMEFVRGTDE